MPMTCGKCGSPLVLCQHSWDTVRRDLGQLEPNTPLGDVERFPLHDRDSGESERSVECRENYGHITGWVLGESGCVEPEGEATFHA